MSKAAVIKGNKLVATADTVAEAKAYAKKVGGLALVPVESGARKNGALSDADKKVIRAFTEHRPAEGKRLSTDGQRIDGLWMGGQKIAIWGDGDQIHFHNLGSKAAETVQRAIAREVPKNWLAESGARRNGAKSRPKWVNEAFEDVRIRWSGAGHYWMTGPRGSGELDLGKCKTESELRKQVRDTIQIGTSDDDWSGWSASK